MYYDTLPDYIEAIFGLTQAAVGGEEEDVAKQAIEFWCSICEEETDDSDRFTVRSANALCTVLCVCSFATYIFESHICQRSSALTVPSEGMSLWMSRGTLLTFANGVERDWLKHACSCTFT